MRFLKVLALVSASVLVLVAMALGAPIAYAQDTGGIIVGGERVIESGEVYKGDMAIFGGNLTVRQGGTIEGNIAIFGGNVEVSGTIRGNAAIFGGSLRLRETAVLDGNITRIGGSVDRAPGATVRGQSIVPNRVPSPPVAPVAPVPPAAPVPPVAPVPPMNIQVSRNPIAEFVGWLVGTAASAIGLGVLAILALLLLPRHLHTVSDTIRVNPAATAGMGALTWLVWLIIVPLVAIVSFILLFVCIGLLGAPILLVLIVGLPLAVLFGWLATGMIVGDALMRGLRIQGRVPLVSIAVGTILITGVFSLLDSIACIGGPLAWLLTLPGLGAVILSWFGTRTWRPGDPYLPGRFGGGPASPTPPAPGWTPPVGTGAWSGPTSETPTASPATGLVAGGSASGDLWSAGGAGATASRTPPTESATDDFLDEPPSPWAGPRAARVLPERGLALPEFETPRDISPTTTSDLLSRLDADVDQGDDELSRDHEGLWKAATAAQAAVDVTTTEERAPVVGPDNLRGIPGIGPVYESLFMMRGVTTYAQLADLSPEQVSDILTGDRVIPVTDDEARTMIAEARRLVGKDE